MKIITKLIIGITLSAGLVCFSFAGNTQTYSAKSKVSSLSAHGPLRPALNLQAHGPLRP